MARVFVILTLAVLIGLPLWLRPRASATRDDDRRLIILSPHNEQIRVEFGDGFSAWHESHYGEPVNVIWNTPGGTSDIRRMLLAQYRAALRSGGPLGGSADLLFGGGSYEFIELRKPIEVVVDGETRSTTVLAPVEFDESFLREVYGEVNLIGDDPLWDAEGHWFGVALSGFGIVFNREALVKLGIPEPTRWADLGDPRMLGHVSLVNPAQSGSISTAFEAILLRRGWDVGWAILRRAAANARSFSASSARGPIDVAQGDAAAGICIDFYGRFEAQAVLEAGGGDRVGYVDPAGETRIDADPIAMLRGAPDPELARRFIEFALSEAGQALWQFKPRGVSDPRASRAAGETDDARTLGPRHFELRRMPIRQSMYRPPHFQRLVDQVNPFEIATAVKNPDRNGRALIAPLFSAMAIDSHHELRQAWQAIIAHPAFPAAAERAGDRPAMAGDTTDPVLREMLERFDAMPQFPGPRGRQIPVTDPESRALLRNGWLREEWEDERLWPSQATPADDMRRRARAFFIDQYARIVALADTQARSASATPGKS